jgi:hypothetical protein
MVQFSSPTATAHLLFFKLVAATYALVAGAVFAQHDQILPAPPPSRPAPLMFDSVLSRYKPMTDQKLGGWREANDNVGQIGGWRTYLKDAQQPEVAGPAAPAASDSPRKTVTPSVPTAPDPHAGHGPKP